MMRWNSTKTYTEDDIMRMQQEAVQRVHEMQERAQQMGYYDYEPEPTIGEYHKIPIAEAESKVVDQPPDTATVSQQQPSNLQANNDSKPKGGLLSNLNLDSESLLIMGLMYLLYNEKADYPLLLALGYLLL